MAVICTNDGPCFPVPLAGGALAQEKRVTLCDWLAERENQGGRREHWNGKDLFSQEKVSTEYEFKKKPHVRL